MAEAKWRPAVRTASLAATVRHFATVARDVAVPAEIAQPWLDYARTAAVAAQHFGVITEADRDAFSKAFASAWQEAAIVLARPSRQASLSGFDPSNAGRILIMTCHFPEALRLLPLAPTVKAQVLMCHDASWFGWLQKAGSLLITGESDAGAKLRKAMSIGQPLACMVDHLARDTTAVVKAPFFRQPMPTDVTVLRAARNSRYKLLFVSSRDGENRVAEVFDPQGLSDLELATRINAMSEREIRAAPSRWLLWPALPARSRSVSGRTQLQ